MILASVTLSSSGEVVAVELHGPPLARVTVPPGVAVSERAVVAQWPSLRDAARAAWDAHQPAVPIPDPPPPLPRSLDAKRLRAHAKRAYAWSKAARDFLRTFSDKRLARRKVREAGDCHRFAVSALAFVLKRPCPDACARLSVARWACAVADVVRLYTDPVERRRLHPDLEADVIAWWNAPDGRAAWLASERRGPRLTSWSYCR